jgi:hypothetical protein
MISSGTDSSALLMIVPFVNPPMHCKSSGTALSALLMMSSGTALMALIMIL